MANNFVVRAGQTEYFPKWPTLQLASSMLIGTLKLPDHFMCGYGTPNDLLFNYRVLRNCLDKNLVNLELREKGEFRNLCKKKYLGDQS